MSQLAERELELRAYAADSFEAYAPIALRIRQKDGSMQPFRLNRSQRYVHEKLEEQRRKLGRVRALILKARQVGISTYIGGRFYWRTTHNVGLRAFILTHLDTASDNLFGMAKRYHDNCPAMFKPTTGAANAKELSFSKLDSGYKVATAGSSEVGRSETIQLFHGSEVAFWPNAINHSAGISQAIADADGTEDIRESTANGIGNAFHSQWKAAERGESDFIAIFVPWFWHEEYSTPLEDDGWTPTDAWAEYAKLYGLDREQTYWAWLKNRKMAVIAGGTSDEPCWQFRQEYPANADEAFQTSGEQAFIEPMAVLRGRKNSVTGYGPIILGVDPARGGGDKTGIIDRQGRRLGGHVCRRIDLNDLMAVAGEVQQLVKTIKPAKVVIDTTGLGSGLYDRLKERLGDLVLPVNFANSALDKPGFTNRRAEIWDLMRQWFDDPAGVQVPDEDIFQSDICSIKRGRLQNGKMATHFNSSGQLVLESKDSVYERLKFSPDLGDAAALTFAIDMSTQTEDDLHALLSKSRRHTKEGAWLGM